MSKEPLPIDDVILSEAEAARMLGFATLTLTNYRLRGVGPPYFQVSGHVVRYSKRRLLDWLEARTVEDAKVQKVEEESKA